MDKQRCYWCTADAEYRAYHDKEWGVPSYNAQHLFEMLLLEGFQAGLSWLTVLKKRENYRKVLFNFDPHKIATMSDDYIEQLLQDKGIIRNRLKVNAARKNAMAWLKLEDPVQFIWSFVGSKPKINHFKKMEQIPVTIAESDAMSKALKKLGFTFVGSTICYAYMQAVGMVMDHTTDCFRYKQIIDKLNK
ncbi:DNA-3-methyladenine glycosylase I [Entomomonas asaccharolytica]|uniref:DNA-3-methyladenine glycosylase I n=1 Tax=Entomomonas asaccharolytica TaxID=2785331 RepID=A0A974RYJ3_9GAMM|nr:DNA-3-methyladenine glycosylase I [Entomomonas asaccharolytica]QQP85924.1 DNA-3-methyladenine glycosylase I [Entomomonas asaccharolytica]